MNILEVQNAFYRLNFQRYELLAPNVYLPRWLEADLFGVRKSGYCDEVEIKVSKSDFKADFKKSVRREDKERPRIYGGRHYGYEYKNVTKHSLLLSGDCKPNYFSFLVPEDIAWSIDIPDYAGLYIARDIGKGMVQIIEKKTAPRLHKEKLSDAERYEIGRKVAYRFWDLSRVMANLKRDAA